MPESATLDTCTPHPARAALGEAIAAMDAFDERFREIAEAIDDGREEEAVRAAGELLPHLVELAAFCESVGVGLPAAREELLALAGELEAAFGEAVAALDRYDFVIFAEAVRYRLAPFGRRCRACFARWSGRRVPSLPVELPEEPVAPAPSEAILRANLEALGDRLSPGLAELLESPAASAGGGLAWREGGWYQRGAEGAWLAVHSPLAPRAEAARRVDAWARRESIEWNETLVAVGAGALYQVEAMAERVDELGIVIVVEPDAGVLRLALSSRDLRHLASRPVVFIGGAELSAVAGAFYQLIQRRLCLDVRAMAWRPWQLANPEGCRRTMDALLEQARVETTNRCTLAAFSDEWQQNALLNLPMVLRHPGVISLRQRFAGWPAVVVAAGPSLNDALPAIAALRERAVILAVGTALRPLLAAGIEPHLIVQVDSDPVTMKQFAGPSPSRSYLLAADSVFPGILRPYEGRYFGFTSTLDEYSHWLSSLGANPGQLAIGGTVTLTALDAAIFLGCDPILFAGLDLAMADDGTSHAANSMYDGHRYPLGKLVRVPGNYAETVPTTQQFANYLQIFGHYLEGLRQHHQVEVVNVNTRGARLPGVRAIRPEEAVGLVGDRGGDAWPILAAGYDEAPPPDRKRVRQGIRKTIRSLSRARQLATRAAGFCQREQLTGAEQGRLRRTESQLQDLTTAMQLLNGAIRGVSMHTGSHAAKATTAADLMACSRGLYEQIAGAADWLQGLLEPVLGQVAEQTIPTERRRGR